MSTDRDDWSRFLDEDDDKVHEELYVMLVICYRDVEFNTGRRQGGDLDGIPGGHTHGHVLRRADACGNDGGHRSVGVYNKRMLVVLVRRRAR